MAGGRNSLRTYAFMSVELLFQIDAEMAGTDVVEYPNLIRLHRIQLLHGNICRKARSSTMKTRQVSLTFINQSIVDLQRRSGCLFVS